VWLKTGRSEYTTFIVSWSSVESLAANEGLAEIPSKWPAWNWNMAGDWSAMLRMRWKHGELAGEVAGGGRSSAVYLLNS
jgi:hypothetical protein